MNIRVFFLSVLPIFLLHACNNSSTLEKANQPPNIVFVMVDDLSWSDLSYNGSTVYETPNVDKLTRQGMTFSDFYTAGPATPGI